LAKDTAQTLINGLSLICEILRTSSSSGGIASHQHISPTFRLQELDLSLGTYVNDNPVKANKWLKVFKRHLPKQYQLLKTVRLIGIYLIVYRLVHSQICLTSAIYNATMPTGFLNFGNKGGVGISLAMNNTTICFINCHLSAGNELQKRNQDFHAISQMRFTNGKGIYDHDIIFWFGDLNYRLDTTMNYDEVVSQIEQGNTVDLVKYDQLRRQQMNKEAFTEFHEPLSLPFRPTYKYDLGTSNWDTSDKRRIPAWCDRVLYWSKNKHLKIAQYLYTSVEEMVISDHKPVIARFTFATKIEDKVKKQKVYDEVIRELY